MKEKLSKATKILEIVLAVILFVVMIVMCGLYINVKINGKNSGLPTLSEQEKTLLLKSAATESADSDNNFLSPLFVGVKLDDNMIAPMFHSDGRGYLEELAASTLRTLFDGDSEQVAFNSEHEKNEYIFNLKNKNEYLYFSFYGNLHSAVFAPCLGIGHGSSGNDRYFYVKDVFALKDNDGNIYGVAVSADGNVNVLYPSQKVMFNQLSLESYDVSEGFCSFKFEETDRIVPLLAGSFLTNDYLLQNVTVDCENADGSPLVNELFDMFGFTHGLVNSYLTNRNTVVNYVDSDIGKLLVNENGYIEFTAEEKGIPLEKYVGFVPHGSGSFTFDDKLSGVMVIINRLENIQNNQNTSNLTKLSLVDCIFNNQENTLTFCFKHFVNGVAVTENDVDVYVVIRDDSIVYIKGSLVVCTENQSTSLYLSQYHSISAFETDEGDMFEDIYYYPVLVNKETEEVLDDGKLVTPVLGRRSYKAGGDR